MRPIRSAVAGPPKTPQTPQNDQTAQVPQKAEVAPPAPQLLPQQRGNLGKHQSR